MTKSNLIVMLVAATILAVTVLLINNLYQANENAVNDRFREHQSLVGRHLGQQIEQSLRDPSRDVQVLSGYASIQHRDTEVMTADIHEWFNLQNRDYVKAISVYDAKGTIICSTTEEATGQNHSNSDFFQWATRKENKGKLFISSLIRAEDNHSDRPPSFRFLIVTPVYQETFDSRYRTPGHEFVGVLTAAIDLDEIVDAFIPMLSTNLTKEQVWIMDTVGSVLTHSKHPEMISRNIRRQDETCMQCHISFDYIDTILAERQGTVEYALREQPRKLATFVPFRYENASWIIVVNVPLDVVSGLLQKQKALAILLIGAMLIVLAGAFVMFNRSNRLMIRAQEEAKQWREKRELENRIRESEEHYRQLVESSPDLIAVCCEEKIVFVNAAAVHLLGATSTDELIGKPALEIVYPDDREMAKSRMAGVLAEGKPAPMAEERLLRVDGNAIDVEDAVTFTTHLGKPAVQVVGRDTTERKRIGRRLEEERNLLRTIIEAIPDEIAVKDVERRFLVVNPATVRALNGASAEEIIGKRDEDLIPEHLLKEAKWEENAVLAVGGHTQNRVADKVDPETGEIERSLLISKIPLKDSNGKIIGLVGINRDITELKRIEEMLQKERSLLLTLIESIPDEVSLKDLRHRFVVANSASIKALGAASLEALIGKTDQDFVPLAFVQQHIAEEEAIVASGEPIINLEQTKIDPATGEIEKCTLTTKVPVKDKTGKTMGILAVNRNITNRKRAEEGLRASEEKFRALFEESKDCIYISSADGKLLDVNAAGVEMFGYGSKEELLRMDLGSDLYVDSQQRAEFLRRMNQQGFVKDFEATMKRKDGKKLTIVETATAVRDKQGKIVMHRGTIRDVTNQRQLERQVGQSQKMESLGLLAGGIAHDFNNILGIILGHTAVVEGAGKDPEQLKDSIGEITTAVQRGASLVRQILTFARKSDATDEPIRVNTTIRELGKMIDDTFPKTITVSLNLDKTIPIIMMDQTQLHQTLLNLCVNARDAITDSSTGNLGRGEIRIQTSVVKNHELRKKFSEATAMEYVCIAVSDSGMGMDEETKQKIYEPFFTTKERGKGTGLGLSVVYGIIESHHGHIEVESDIGHGTTFRLYLPVTDAVATPAPPPEDGTRANVRGNETILLVEDEPNLLGLMKTALERAGYTVLTAMDGVSAIRTFSLNKKKIALVLTDVDLPKLDGAAVFTSMKDIDPNAKIILASGYLDPNVKSNLLRSGAKDFIQKPYSPGIVLKMIREVLDGSP